MEPRTSGQESMSGISFSRPLSIRMNWGSMFSVQVTVYIYISLSLSLHLWSISSCCYGVNSIVDQKNLISTCDTLIFGGWNPCLLCFNLNVKFPSLENWEIPRSPWRFSCTEGGVPALVSSGTPWNESQWPGAGMGAKRNTFGVSIAIWMVYDGKSY